MTSPNSEIDDTNSERNDEFIHDFIPEGEEETIQLTYTNRWMKWELNDVLTIDQIKDYYDNRLDKKFANKITIEEIENPIGLRITLTKLDTVARHHPNNTIFFIKAPPEQSKLKKPFDLLTDFYETIIARKLLTPLVSIYTRVSFKGKFEKMVSLDILRSITEKFIESGTEYAEYEPELLKHFKLRNKAKNITLLIAASGNFTGISSSSEEDIQEFTDRVYYSLKKILKE
ncbi:MAG: hypothetical protein ACTSYA_04750 [Candidatus Kariarchaeaceae archaeon]